MINETTYVMRPLKGQRGRRLINGFAVSAVTRVGQRYTEVMEVGYWAPVGLFEVRDVSWHATANAAARAIIKLSKAQPSAPRFWGAFGELTFTASCNGPGFWESKKQDGPLFAIIPELPKATDPMNAIFPTTASLKP